MSSVCDRMHLQGHAAGVSWSPQSCLAGRPSWEGMRRSQLHVEMREERLGWGPKELPRVRGRQKTGE